MRKLFTLLLAVAASVGTMFAWDYEKVQIGDLYYNLDATNQTAEVTHQNSGNYSGDIVIPSSVTFNLVIYSVTSIGESAFIYCSFLTSITIPNSVTSIGGYAFSYCTGLKSVTIPNSVTSIGDRAFQKCTGLTSPVYNAHVFAFMPTTYSGAYTIPDGIESIAGDAFRNCTRLVSVTIPNSVTSIGNYAFIYCSGLTSVTIGNSVTSIGEHAFSGCNRLYSLTIGNSVTSIGEHAFDECTGLAAPVCNAHIFAYLPQSYSGAYAIPQGIEIIAATAFYNCTSLTSVTIPNSVTSIGDYAFFGCYRLTSITIPNSVTSIGVSAFQSCSGLTSIEIPNSVTSIGERAFSDCAITSITIPNSVTSIGEAAFFACVLTSINVDASNPYYCSVDGVLFNKAKSTLIQYPTRRKESSYIIPNSVTSIGYVAFFGCTGLTSITIPNSVTSIGDYAFDGCSFLTSITIPNSVTSIGDYAFSGCNRLYSLTIGNSVTSIGKSAFAGCNELGSVTIPNSVTSIGEGAFTMGKDFTSVTCEATTPPAIGQNAFTNASSGKTLYVPVGSFNAYKGWGNFTNLKPISAVSVNVTTNTTSGITESRVTISWPQVTGAKRYEIEIRYNNVVVCSISFNNQGQLLSIVYKAPSRSGKRENMAAQALADGWKYTVNGLDAGKTYTYSVIAKDAYGTTIDTKSGSFTTTGEPQGVEEVLSNQVPRSSATARSSSSAGRRFTMRKVRW